MDSKSSLIETASISSGSSGTGVASFSRDATRSANNQLCEGEVLAGRYRVLSVLGTGGTGTVYKVEQIFLHAFYALKLLNAPLLNTITETRFQKEAQACHQLDHPNLIKVHDYDLMNDNRPFIVMDLCEGPTLAEVLKKEGSLSIDRALDLFIEICDGLASAHAQGVVHRDLKPNNIIVVRVDDRDTIRIVDFGIAKMLHGESIDTMALTRTGEIFGTPLYMSPEQCMSKPVDNRSDIYSIGCALFETLAGVPPFIAENTLTTMIKHQSELPATLREASLGKQFSSDLERIVAKMLAKMPEERYQTISDVRNHLQSVRANRPIGWDAPAEKQKKQTKHAAFPTALSALLFGIGFGTIFVFFTLAKSLIVHNEFCPKVTVSDYDNFPSAPSVPSTSKFAPVSITDAKSGPWTLNFPSPSIGRLVAVQDWHYTPVLEWEGDGGIDATGTIRFKSPRPIAFKPSWGMDPRMFRRFRNDEIIALNLHDDTEIDDDSLVFINHLTGLRVLNLCNNVQVTNHGLQNIAELPNLRQLDVSWTQIDGDGLSQFPPLRQLQVLWANRTPKVSKMLSALEHSDNMQQLRLCGCDLTDADLQKVAQISGVVYLGLSGNPNITATGIKSLAPMRKLVQLDLRDCSDITSVCEGISKFKSLRTVLLSNVDDVSAKQLLKAPFLQHLVLASSTELTDRGVVTLAKMPNLVRLDLSQTATTPKCVADLKTMPNLHILAVPSAWDSLQVRNFLKDQLPNCRVNFERQRRDNLKLE